MINVDKDGPRRIAHSHLRACSFEDVVSSRSLDHGAPPVRAGGASASRECKEKKEPQIFFKIVSQYEDTQVMRHINY